MNKKIIYDKEWEQETIQYLDKEGNLHREDGPALIRQDGANIYYKHREAHRQYGPSSIFADGYRAFYRNGNRTKHIYYRK